MTDKYADFDALARNEVEGVDYRVVLRHGSPTFALVAPHGGGIEPGTSELAATIARDRFSLYTFEGLKKSGNTSLHITSTRFDEASCVALVSQCETVVTVHGENRSATASKVFIGGRDESLAQRLEVAFAARGFSVEQHAHAVLRGLDRRNLCNRGKSARGVQLELSRALRSQMFQSLSRAGRRHPTSTFFDFVDTVVSVLDASSSA